MSCKSCNSLYFYVVNAIGQVTWVARIATHHTYGAIECKFIATLSKQLIFNYYATPLKLQQLFHVDVINSHPSIRIWHMALWGFLDLKITF
jgi:hypothetical protein